MTGTKYKIRFTYVRFNCKRKNGVKMDGKSAIRGGTLPNLVSISKVLEGILVICPALTSKKMCGKMWLKKRKARPRELYTISSRYANFVYNMIHINSESHC